MQRIVRQSAWLFATAVALICLIFVLLEYRVSSSLGEDSLGMIVEDVLRPGAHHLSGTVILSSACDSFTVESEKIDTFRYRIVFETWPEPQRDCEKMPTPRPFKLTVFAPSIGVAFSAEIDGNPLPMTVVRAYR